MNYTERRMQILTMVQDKQIVEVMDLASKFDVAPMTIRRDLKFFEKQGLVTTNYGGAYLNRNSSIEPSFSIKSGQSTDSKASIGKAAAEYVQNGETIILDCGTTVLQMAKYLEGKKLTIITNSIPVVNYLGDSSKIKLIIVPGEYNSISAGSFGATAMEFFSKFHADKVFMGTHGCSIERGATVPELYDAEVKKAILNAGGEKFLLADHSKFDNTYLVKHAALEDYTYIVTDSELPKKLKGELSKLETKLIIAK